MYPKMLFRPGSEITWEGHDLDTLTVDGIEAEADARAEGWCDAATILMEADAESSVVTLPRRGRPPRAA